MISGRFFRVFSGLALTLASVTVVADADLILRNGRIYTVDSDSGIVEALAVADGKVLAVGTNSEIDRLRDRDTTVIDLVGRFMKAI